ncbi:hypothetical protein ACVWYF_000115 [Hymenobacter sp. UYAg731]
MNNIEILLGLLMISACSQQKQPVQQFENKDALTSKTNFNSQLDTATFAVLPFSKKSDYLFLKSRPAKLTAVEIQQVNDLLSKAVAEQNQAEEKDFQKMIKIFLEAAQHRENYFINLSRYRRQFIAVINPKGEKKVWVNCFCSSEPNWRKKELVVDDGGNCYFNVKINLTKAIWYEMMVNGEA